MLQQGRPLSLRTRWFLLKARLSTPALLGRFDERSVISLVTAINGAVSILTIGLFAWLMDLPLLFPALGPSAFILFSSPMTVGAAPRNVILGHVSSLLIGWAVVQVVATMTGGTVSMATGGWPLFVGAAVVLGCSCLTLVLLSCPHPPSCASGLIIVMAGGAVVVGDLLFMALAVVCLVFQAVALNRFAGLPVPFWRPRCESFEQPV